MKAIDVEHMFRYFIVKHILLYYESLPTLLMSFNFYLVIKTYCSSAGELHFTKLCEAAQL